MLDLIAACVTGLIVMNAAPPISVQKPQVVAPQSNNNICREAKWMGNRDICDRQAGSQNTTAATVR